MTTCVLDDTKINSDLGTWMKSCFSRRLPCRSRIVDIHVAGPQDVDFDKVTGADFGPDPNSNQQQ